MKIILISIASMFLISCSTIKPISYSVNEKDKLYPINLIVKYNQYNVVTPLQAELIKYYKDVFKKSNQFSDVETAYARYNITIIADIYRTKSLFSEITKYPNVVISGISLGIIPMYDSGEIFANYVVLYKGKEIKNISTNKDFYSFTDFLFEDRNSLAKEYLNTMFLDFIVDLKNKGSNDYVKY